MENCLVVGNWKMNSNLTDALALSSLVYKNTQKFKNIDVVLAPPSIFIYPVAETIKNKRGNFSLGIQNVMYLDSGEFTGEVSPAMAKGLCKYAIIGHSDRRKYFGETDEVVNAKLKAVLKNGMRAIVCVGEKERYHLEDHFDYEVKRMKTSGGIIGSVEKSLAGISSKDFAQIVVAYEPVWAIGSSNAANGAYAASISYILKSHLKEKFGEGAEQIKIIYGGSVNPKNAQEFLVQPNIDGLLVGGSSLKSREFLQICKVASETKSS